MKSHFALGNCHMKLRSNLRVTDTSGAKDVLTVDVRHLAYDVSTFDASGDITSSTVNYIPTHIFVEVCRHEGYGMTDMEAWACNGSKCVLYIEIRTGRGLPLSAQRFTQSMHMLTVHNLCLLTLCSDTHYNITV